MRKINEQQSFGVGVKYIKVNPQPFSIFAFIYVWKS
jgi:hypothetical protein